MKRISLVPYKCHLPELVEMKKNIVELLFVIPPEPRELLKKEELAQRIEKHEADTITIEDSEWSWLVKGLETAKIKERQFVEFVRRILDAETVPVKD